MRVIQIEKEDNSIIKAQVIEFRHNKKENKDFIKYLNLRDNYKETSIIEKYNENNVEGYIIKDTIDKEYENILTTDSEIGEIEKLPDVIYRNIQYSHLKNDTFIVYEDVNTKSLFVKRELCEKYGIDYLFTITIGTTPCYLVNEEIINKIIENAKEQNIELTPIYREIYLSDKNNNILEEEKKKIDDNSNDIIKETIHEPKKNNTLLITICDYNGTLFISKDILLGFINSDDILITNGVYMGNDVIPEFVKLDGERRQIKIKGELFLETTAEDLKMIKEQSDKKNIKVEVKYKEIVPKNNYTLDNILKNKKNK